MTAIWETCLYQGGTLNVLLAMADSASRPDGTGIFPGLDYLSAKCRQSVRATQDSIKRLRGDLVVIQLGPNGEDLTPEQNAIGGRGHRTEYRIDMKRVRKLQALHRLENPDCAYCAAGDKADPERVQEAAEKGEVSAVKGADNDVKGEVSRSHIEEPLEPEVEPLREPSAPQAALALGKIPIPDWIPAEAWAGFVEMRKKIRVPLTERAILLTIADLKKLRSTEDIGAVLDQSTQRSWRSVFPVKHQNGGQHGTGTSNNRGGASTAHQRHLEGLALLVDEADRSTEGISGPGPAERRLAAHGRS